ncbi:hypothetical protein GCM10011594_22750 [Nakamurella endophytica]|uniref:DUF306 domain-containing protein n=1 Tax=Nakamurella endophytica TaxID=1748367 RepID=A0A917SY54_9ACTN|nr:hypothetical protein GCM10011594_22750 [Nakamurella endophytica]
MDFAGDRLSADAGCNIHSATVVLRDGRLAVSDVVASDMACPGARGADDAWLARFLAAGPEYRRDGGTVVLSATGATVRLEAEQPRRLTGTQWVLDGLVTGDTVSSVPGGLAPTVVLSRDQLQISGACNSGSGPVTVTEDELRIGSVITTQRACGGARDDVDRALLAVIRGTVAYRVDGNRLTVTAEDGRGLVFAAAQEPVPGPAGRPTTGTPLPGLSITAGTPPPRSTAPGSGPAGPGLDPTKSPGPDATIPEGPGMRR